MDTQLSGVSSNDIDCLYLYSKAVVCLSVYVIESIVRSLEGVLELKTP